MFHNGSAKYLFLNLYRGSSNWLYYTSSDKNTSIKIPISKEGKDCTDDQGCKEIYDGDQINIPAYNGSFKVKMYKFDIQIV